MSVTIKVNLGKITEMRGSTNVEGGSIVENSKQVTGVVTQIDPNGLQLRVKVDGSSTKNYSVTNNTEVFKGNHSVRFKHTLCWRPCPSEICNSQYFPYS